MSGGEVEREGQRIWNRLCSDSSDPNVGFKLNQLSHPCSPERSFFKMFPRKHPLMLCWPSFITCPQLTLGKMRQKKGKLCQQRGDCWVRIVGAAASLPQPTCMGLTEGYLIPQIITVICPVLIMCWVLWSVVFLLLVTALLVRWYCSHLLMKKLSGMWVTWFFSILRESFLLNHSHTSQDWERL